jgi:hypothetical protein
MGVSCLRKLSPPHSYLFTVTHTIGYLIVACLMRGSTVETSDDRKGLTKASN